MGDETLQALVEKEARSIWEKMKRAEEIYKKWARGELVLRPSSKPATFIEFLVRADFSLWLYVLICLIVATVSLVYVSESARFLTILRYVLGSIFVLFIPGYTLVQALYEPGELTPLEELALSIGLSLAIVPLIGLVLNYTPWGIRLSPIVFSLSVFSLALGLLATYRRYRFYQRTL